MNWRLQTTLAGILGAIGLFIVFNPVTIVTAAAGIIPWLLLAAGAIQFISIAFRSRRLLRLIIVPAVTGALFVYAGVSMKFGDPTTVGPVSLVFILALVFFGSGAAKLVTGLSMRRSRYFLYIIASGAVSIVLGLIVMFNWSTVSAGLIGVFLGLEVIADAAIMAVLALRERDGEAAMESLGLDPVAEAAKAEAARAARAAKAAAEAAAIDAAAAAEAAKARPPVMPLPASAMPPLVRPVPPAAEPSPPRAETTADAPPAPKLPTPPPLAAPASPPPPSAASPTEAPPTVPKPAGSEPDPLP
ncbi:HdeD family acid-resistance protein [Polymorphobacter fuscus]|uniref:DUF308 domain-containing protein n=1 Tax=Sandarakinorhabdus fusca TaxID=1439888 RepID=A0A7C9KXN6_9SPHN|nr:hypothetical protein [Polymorphobacter fuscus]KAB7646406.1 hypothetical protein F9290_10250 [Polymorphobacter fuscus]MQT17642.1 hypothetical protein [Polymorphobacter fuscus]NJC09814.1 uncharacterized membrane protein HdeD (DUF308 family) [Polymorphobacter fuscus]